MEEQTLEMHLVDDHQLMSSLKCVRNCILHYTQHLNKVRQQDHLPLQQLDQDLQTRLNLLTQLYQLLIHKLGFTPLDIQRATHFYKNSQQMLKLPSYCHLDYLPLRQIKTKHIGKGNGRGPYRSYTIEEKQYVVYLHHKGNTFAFISKQLSIPQKNVVRWCRQSMNGKPFNRRNTDQRMERELAQWVLVEGKEKVLTLAEIQLMGKQLTENPQFRASRGWAKNFLKRYSNTLSPENK